MPTTKPRRAGDVNRESGTLCRYSRPSAGRGDVVTEDHSSTSCRLPVPTVITPSP